MCLKYIYSAITFFITLQFRYSNEKIGRNDFSPKNTYNIWETKGKYKEEMNKRKYNYKLGCQLESKHFLPRQRRVSKSPWQMSELCLLFECCLASVCPPLCHYKSCIFHYVVINLLPDSNRLIESFSTN